MTPAALAEWIRVAPWLVAAVLLIMLAVWAVRKAAPVLRKLGHLVDDLVGEPARPGVPPRPGLMERMESVEGEQKRQGTDLALVKHEVMPNTGTSLNDATRRTEAHVKELDAKVGEALAWQRKHEEKSDAIVARVNKIEEKQNGNPTDP